MIDKVIAIVGPTASGKTDYALRLCRENGYPLINADSYSLYRGMDIGTAKPTGEELQGVEHYAFSVVEPSEAISIGKYQEIVLPLFKKLEGTVVLCGGSGLYIKSVIDKIELAPFDLDTRNRLYRELEANGIEPLFKRLQKLDPASALKIPMENDRRVIRALEVIEQTGKPYVSDLEVFDYRYPTEQFMLKMDLEQLHERIKLRAKKMLDSGLVNEVETLRPTLGVTAIKAIGYKETLQYLDNQITLEQLEELIVIHTNQLVKKQLTWFRKDGRIKTVE